MHREMSQFSHEIVYCTFDSNRSSRNGGAIYLASEASLVINESDFLNNTAGRMPGSMGGSGGAIYAQNAALAVQWTVFENNSSADLGGAIFVGAASVVLVEQSIFNLNKSGNPLQLHSVYIAIGGGYLDDENTFYLDSNPYWEQ